jgi:hypothetical protein
MSKKFTDYKKEDLFNKIDKISIELVGNQVITKFDNRVISVANVSDKYEIFDIKGYLKSKIELIEKNFTICKYHFGLTKGIQEVTLLSDDIKIGNYTFQKSFFILNSSDKSRKLNFNAGLLSKDQNFCLISKVKNVGLTKKHLKGLTKAAEVAIENINSETFDEQIESISSLIDHRVSLSKIKEIIVDDPDVNVNHLKFDGFKNQILYYSGDKRLSLTNDQLNTLRTPSKRLDITSRNDFYMDAFWTLQTYLKLYANQDSHIIKRESEKIMKITQFAIRNNVLESLGI